MACDVDEDAEDDDDELVDLAQAGGDLFFLFLAPDNEDKLKCNSTEQQNQPSIPGGQSESVFKTCDVWGQVTCFVYTDTSNMAAISPEMLK